MFLGMTTVKSFWWRCIKLAHADSAAFANDWQWFFGVPIFAVSLTWVARWRGYSEISIGNPIADAVLAGAGAFLITYLVRFIPRLLSAPNLLYQEQKTLAEAKLSDKSESLRIAIQRLLNFPAAAADFPDPPNLLESVVTDQQPRKLFELLARASEQDIRAIPEAGQKLQEHLESYHKLREKIEVLENNIYVKIVNGRDWFPAAWRILLRYAVLRLFGMSREQIVAAGNFLNYSITWERAENEFERISQDEQISKDAAEIDSSFESFGKAVAELKASLQ